MLGNAVRSFSICVSHGPETRNSLFFSASAMILLNRATSRVVIPSCVRTCFSRSPGSGVLPVRRRMSFKGKEECDSPFQCFDDLLLWQKGSLPSASARQCTRDSGLGCSCAGLIRSRRPLKVPKKCSTIAIMYVRVLRALKGPNSQNIAIRQLEIAIKAAYCNPNFSSEPAEGLADAASRK